jgi:hypothetical protein
LGSLILTVKLALLADARLFRYEIEVGEDGQKRRLRPRSHERCLREKRSSTNWKWTRV